MQILQNILTFLGPPYKITIIDGENVIYRKLENGVEFEVSYIRSLTGTCILYVWAASPKEIIGIYENIPVKSLKDILGYYATKYQNLTAEIRVEREDQIK